MIASLVIASLCACSSARTSHTSGEHPKPRPRLIYVGDPAPQGNGRTEPRALNLANGASNTPVASSSYDEIGLASYYGDVLHGRQTANGEIYDMNALSAAHATMPLPAYARVTNLANNRQVIVRVNDRGPFKGGRIIDLSRRAAELLGFYELGTARVQVQYYGPAPLHGDDTLEQEALAAQPWAPRLFSTSRQRAPATRTAISSKMLNLAATAAAASSAPAVPYSGALWTPASRTSWESQPAAGLGYEK